MEIGVMSMTARVGPDVRALQRPVGRVPCTAFASVPLVPQEQTPDRCDSTADPRTLSVARTLYEANSSTLRPSLTTESGIAVPKDSHVSPHAAAALRDLDLHEELQILQRTGQMAEPGRTTGSVRDGRRSAHSDRLQGPRPGTPDADGDEASAEARGQTAGDNARGSANAVRPADQGHHGIGLRGPAHLWPGALVDEHATSHAPPSLPLPPAPCHAETTTAGGPENHEEATPDASCGSRSPVQPSGVEEPGGEVGSDAGWEAVPGEVTPVVDPWAGIRRGGEVGDGE